MTLLERYIEKQNYPMVKLILECYEKIQLQNGKMMQLLQPDKIKCLNDAEFQVYSQWGEDGIIQWLLKKIPIVNNTFIEFGVEDYTEANTLFLLKNNNWSGMVIDGSKEAIERVREKNWYWKYDLKAVASFITRENIESVLAESGFDRDLGLLSVDIDGNDWWVLKNINNYSPRILICEYNAVFGYDKSVTIPYAEDFYRTNAHYSNLYWGASYRALKELAEQKGYVFVGTNSNANNMFFVRKDLVSYIDYDLEKIPLYEQKYRESRDEEGNITLISTLSKKREVIKDMPLYDIENDMMIKVSDI